MNKWKYDAKQRDSVCYIILLCMVDKSTVGHRAMFRIWAKKQENWTGFSEKNIPLIHLNGRTLLTQCQKRLFATKSGKSCDGQSTICARDHSHSREIH